MEKMETEEDTAAILQKAEEILIESKKRLKKHKQEMDALTYQIIHNQKNLEQGPGNKRRRIDASAVNHSINEEQNQINDYGKHEKVKQDIIMDSPEGNQRKRKRKSSSTTQHGFKTPTEMSEYNNEIQQCITHMEEEFLINKLIISLNCRGIRNTIDQLEKMVKDVSELKKPIAILLQETMLKEEEMENLKLEGYRVINTTNQKKGGQRGSMIFISTDYNAIKIPHTKINNNNVELIGIEIQGNTNHTFKNPIHIWNLYCPPNYKASTEAKKLLKEIFKSRKNNDLIAMGDFNCNLIPGSLTQGRPLRTWLEATNEKGEIFIANDYKPTTIQGKSVIDVAITTKRESIATPLHVDLTSDHYPVIMGFSHNDTRKLRTARRIRYARDAETATILKQACIELQNQSHILSGDDLAQKILEVWKNKAIKKGSKKGYQQNKRTNKPWWTKEIDSLFKAKTAIIGKIRNTQNLQERQELQIMLQQLRSELEEEIKRERNNHFQKFASKLNHKHNPDVYRVIKGIEKPAMPKLTSVSIKRKDGTVVTDAQEKVEALAEQYQSPLGIDQPNNIERITIMEQLRSENKKEEQATHEDFTLSEVKIAREQMSDKKAPGQSRVAKEDFETAGQELDVLVQTLANKICKTGKWPKVLKTQVVCPLLKKPEKKNQINQDETRPISLLETLDKWVQKLIYNRIRRHVKFNESQIGYEKGCDLHTTLLSEHIHKHCLSHNIVLFTDISKAFDSVPLHELEIAIWNSTIPTIYKPTMIDFTKGRKYRVEMQVENRDTVSSDWYDQQYGTPQGSVLGPLLWNLFFDPLLEDLSKIQHSLPGLDLAFADDLTILATAQDPRQAEKLIEEKLKCINEFLIERGMQLSIPKLKIMCIRMAADVYLPSVFLNDIKIQTTEAHKFLGVTYDPKFTFQSHLKSLKEKIANRTRAMVYMRGARWGPTQSTMMALYHSYITSVVLNGMMAWYPFLNKRQINSLNADLKRAIRIALGLPRLTPVSVVFIESGADTVNQLANKSAASLYAQINPYSKESNNIAKNHYIIQTPKWARNHLLKSLNSVWKTPLQNRNIKEFLITDNISIHTSTLTNQKETEESENTHDVLLYTDASVNQESIPLGRQQ